MHKNQLFSLLRPSFKVCFISVQLATLFQIVVVYFVFIFFEGLEGCYVKYRVTSNIAFYPR